MAEQIQTYKRPRRIQARQPGHLAPRNLRGAESPGLCRWPLVHHAKRRQNRSRVHQDSRRLRRVALRRQTKRRSRRASIAGIV
jgi:hypothetical protein